MAHSLAGEGIVIITTRKLRLGHALEGRPILVLSIFGLHNGQCLGHNGRCR